MKLNIYRCTRCQHEWASRREKPPHTCPRCRSPYWNKVKWKGVK